MNKADELFLKRIEEIQNGYSTETGDVRPEYTDGTAAHTKYITGVFEKYDLSKGEFPIISFRKIAWKSAIKEILWIYQDMSNDLKLLKEKYDIHWWDNWDIGDGTIGARYGHTVKKYNLIDNLLKDLKELPFGRRHIINLYQYEELNETKGLYPCAMETHFSVREVEKVKYLDMTLIQRSSDYLVANHINKLQYIALMLMIAKTLGYELGYFCHFVQNCHIYDRHFKELDKILEANKEEKENKARLILDTTNTDFYKFTIDDFKMVDYNPTDVKVNLELAI